MKDPPLPRAPLSPPPPTTPLDDNQKNLSNLDVVSPQPAVSRCLPLSSAVSRRLPLSSQVGTIEKVKARLWLWPELFFWLIDSGRGTTRAEDAQGTPTQSHISPSLLVYENDPLYEGPVRYPVVFQADEVEYLCSQSCRSIS